MNGVTVRRLIMVSPVLYGCQYRQENGGCFSCGEAYGLGRTPEVALTVKPIVDEVLKMILNSKQSPEWICWYVEGSNLNAIECPREALEIILTLFASIPSVKRITIESRPEFVTDEVLDLLQKKVIESGVEIEIGIGVETRSDFIRKYCFNKGETFTWKIFEQTVHKIKEKKGLRVLAYVSLKPPFLTEKVSITEAMETIRECFKINVDAVSLELVSIQEFTLVEYLWLKGLYRTPWLWSAIEIVRNTQDSGEIRIGGEPYTYFPASKRAAHNCARCTARVWKTIRNYNETHRLDLFNALACDCKEEWSRLINNEPPSTTEERIINASHNLSLEDYISLKLYNNLMEGN
jgi:radical SAM enzyme (TIGR01210 family)